MGKGRRSKPRVEAAQISVTLGETKNHREEIRRGPHVVITVRPADPEHDPPAQKATEVRTSAQPAHDQDNSEQAWTLTYIRSPGIQGFRLDLKPLLKLEVVLTVTDPNKTNTTKMDPEKADTGSSDQGHDQEEEQQDQEGTGGGFSAIKGDFDHKDGSDIAAAAAAEADIEPSVWTEDELPEPPGGGPQ